MPNAARVGDSHSCPKVEPGLVPHVGGAIQTPGSADIEIEFMPAARTGDLVACAVGGPDTLCMGSGSVEFNGKLAVRMGDSTLHGGLITSGATTVEIGIPGDGVVVKVPESGKSSTAGNGKRKSDSQASSSGKDKKGNGTKSKQNHPPIAVIKIERQLTGDYTVNETVKLRSLSYDPLFGTSPGAGIKTHKWNIRTPSSSLTPQGMEFDLKLGAEGNYFISLTVDDDDNAADTTEEELSIGTICQRAKEDLDFLQKYIDSLIDAGSSSIGSALGMDWASRMLGYWKSGNAGTLAIPPDTVRGMWTVNREQNNIIALLIKEIVPASNSLRDGEERTVATVMERSFYAFTPPQFFASGGSTLRTALSLRLVRTNDYLELNGYLAHLWWDNYDWDVGKDTVIPWPSSERFPYLAEEVHDEWFNLLHRCRGIGKSFRMESRWFHLIDKRVDWPICLFPPSISDVDFVYSEFNPIA